VLTSEYARATARELGIEECFAAFLPKPNVLIDDQEVGTWKRFVVIHPLGVVDRSVEDYKKLVDEALS
jgi:hypothetical protein